MLSVITPGHDRRHKNVKLTIMSEYLFLGFEDAEVSTDLSTLLLRATPVDIERGYITVGKTDGGKKAGNILKKHHAPWTYVCVHCGFTRSAATSTNGIKLIRVRKFF